MGNSIMACVYVCAENCCIANVTVKSVLTDFNIILALIHKYMVVELTSHWGLLSLNNKPPELKKLGCYYVYFLAVLAASLFALNW